MLPRLFVAPGNADPIARHNWVATQKEALSFGPTDAAGSFLPVLLARLGASNIQVGLLSAIPNLAGFLLAVPVGHFLQGRRNVVPWYSRGRFINQLVLPAIGVALVAMPTVDVVPVIIVLVGLSAIVGSFANFSFYAVMDGLSGPHGRYELMGRRWGMKGACDGGQPGGHRLDPGRGPVSPQLPAGVHRHGRCRGLRVPVLAHLPDPGSAAPPEGRRAPVAFGSSTRVRPRGRRPTPFRRVPRPARGLQRRAEHGRAADPALLRPEPRRERRLDRPDRHHAGGAHDDGLLPLAADGAAPRCHRVGPRDLDARRGGLSGSACRHAGGARWSQRGWASTGSASRGSSLACSTS